jgi:serine/threonine protein kinase
MTSTVTQLMKIGGIEGTRTRLGRGANGQIFNIGNGKILKYGTGSLKNAQKEFEMTKRVREQLINKGYEPFVPAVHGNFLHIPGQNGTLFMMNKVPGVTLSKFSTEATPNQLNFIYDKLKQYVKILDELGVIHGDLNPNNVMIEVLANGELKVTIIDFGRSRSTTNTTYGATKYYHWPTKIRCNPNSQRYCALPYVWSTTVNERTANSNLGFLEAVFGKKGGIASRATRLKNAINIINSGRNSLNLASNTIIVPKRNKRGIPTGTTKKIGQKEVLIDLLRHFQNDNDRIQSIINYMSLPRQRQVKMIDKDVQNFIHMLRGIKNAKNIPAITPTSVKRTQLHNGSTAPNSKAVRMNRYSETIAQMRRNVEAMLAARKAPSPPIKMIHFTNAFGVEGRPVPQNNVGMYRQQAMEAAARKAKKLKPLPKMMPITSAELRAALDYYKKNRRTPRSFGFSSPKSILK